ncbi:hypothetical protein AB6T38_15015 [Aliiglaciecola sp. SL4]|uniref:DUF6942 family protein n=1 Tax=Aliiglaciecola sp. SL4 TaxID=3239806 RepID=UPI00355C9682
MADKEFRKISGLGDKNAHINVYIQNRPSFSFEAQQQGLYPLQKGEIYAIGQACGNGWRKVFNVYAKLLFPLLGHFNGVDQRCSTWQQYRDEELLQPGSHTALWFTPPKFEQSDTLHIIMGRTYAKSLNLPNTLEWINQEFAIDLSQRIVVCPYFDYRQLSNHKILFMLEIITQHFLKK